MQFSFSVQILLEKNTRRRKKRQVGKETRKKTIEKKKYKKNSLQVTTAVSDNGMIEGEYRNYSPFHTKKSRENWR
jgi:hypothetical protein